MQKRPHRFVSGLTFDLLRCPNLTQHTIENHCDSMTQRRGLFEIMRDEDRSAMILFQKNG